MAVLEADVCCGLENVAIPAVSDVEGTILSDIKYTPTNVAGPGAPTDPSEIMYAGCDCQTPTCPSDCPCILRYGPTYDNAGCLLTEERENFLRCKPILECNSSCRCGEKCYNRVVQKGVSLKLEVFRTPRKGWGLRAAERIPLGRFVCEYAGEVLGLQEARRRTRNMKHEDMNYILTLREHIASGRVVETHVDPTYIGNVGRYINHSCSPNLLMLPVRVDSEVPKLALFARKDIEVGEELSFDYSGEYGNVATQKKLQKEREKSKDCSKLKPCFCGSEMCAGFLPFDPSLYQVQSK
ncbi:PREDICTED: histone-lysine N-methyltransferase SETMAR-like [Branchiostoma belcheri]|uniref:Histone-lysine N-methyltransferase SETMAR-like n=1 Tax=Branchiostoma belcheri TaxID=7741 RepID=A0A6P4ZHG8_BRABE|nr:PREDICTED: histone-lysine N-methyltransferase SETMAR-like [Branchiostoma belcheri]